MKIETGVELASRTTLGVGGAAAHYAQVHSEADLRAALAWAQTENVPVRVLGGGSNIVVADAGVAGLVIDLQLRGVAVREAQGAAVARVAAGEPWDAFVENMVARGYQGLECLSGIPGRVGATPIQNVGAYGQDVSGTVVGVVAFDSLERVARTFSNPECRFAYRDSLFKSVQPNRFIVTEVTFQLRAGAAPALRYAELERWFERQDVSAPSLTDVRSAVLALRRKKSMLLDPEDVNSRSCGSFFVNPTLGAEAFAEFMQAASGERDIPQFPQPDGRIKLSAGWLIEHSGFPRGMRDGNVGLSTQHALALVAHEGARAEDVLRLSARVQRGVFERFGVALEREPVIWD